MRERVRERAVAKEGTSQPVDQCLAGAGEEERRAEESDWQLVQRKKTEQAKKRLDVARNFNWFEKDAVRTTYFFTNFPENFLAKHMLKAFLKYGEFEEVVIPPKRDKRGLRFGFARVVNVQEPDKFAVMLDNMIIGSDKVMVNLPRFSREVRSRSENKATCKSGVGGRLASIIVDAKSIDSGNANHANGRRLASVIVKPRADVPRTLASVIVNPGDAETMNLVGTPSPEPLPPTFIQQEKVPVNQPFHSPFRPIPTNRNFSYKPPPKPKRPWAHRHFNVPDSIVQNSLKLMLGWLKMLEWRIVYKKNLQTKAS